MDAKKFKVIFTPAAQREIEGLERDDALRVARDAKTYLELSPLPIGKTRIKKLTGFEPPLYRLRSGDCRVYYRIFGQDVVVSAITHKKDSEKVLRRFW